MRYSQTEEMEIIRQMEHSKLSIWKVLEELDMPKSCFHLWYQEYQQEGYDGLANELLQAQDEHRLHRMIAAALNPDLVVLDELGFIPFSPAVYRPCLLSAPYSIKALR